MKKILLIFLIMLVFVMACSKDDTKAKENKVTGVTKNGDMAVMKSRQTEAQLLLKQYFQMQQAYYTQNNTYAKSLKELPQMNIIGDDKKMIYTYKIKNASPSEFIITASGNIDRDDFQDVWQVDQDGKIENIKNDLNNQ